MLILALSAALAAAAIWAASALIAYKPAQALGSFEFTRVTLISASVLLAAIVTMRGGWASIAWVYWSGLVVSGLVGVLLCNLAFVISMRRGGPRRAEFLFAMNTPIAALLGYGFLSESMSTQALAGGALTMTGVILAIFFGHRPKGTEALEKINGSLWSVIAFGLLSGLCQAIGFIAVKPALLAGTDPLAASAIRVIVSAMALMIVTPWRSKFFKPAAKPACSAILRAIPPGVLGYVVASSLLLYALRSYETGIVVVLGSTVPVMILPMLWFSSRSWPPLAAWVAAGVVMLGTALIVIA